MRNPRYRQERAHTTIAKKEGSVLVKYVQKEITGSEVGAFVYPRVHVVACCPSLVSNTGAR